MCKVHLLAGFGVLWFCLLSAAQEPAKPTAEQQEKIQQLIRLQAEVQQLNAAGQPTKAITSAEKALALLRELLGKEHLLIAKQLRFLGQLHEARDDFASARKVREEAVAMLTRLVGKEHWQVTDASLELADGERLAGLAAEERNQLRQATALDQRVGRMYGQGQYREAMPIAQEVAAVRKKVLGENHPDYAHSLNALAMLYKVMGDDTKALPLFEQAREIAKKGLGENHPNYAASLNNLAELYRAMGNYAKALPLFEQARELRKKVLGENHPDYAQSLNNLGRLYYSMGDYAKALSLFEQTRELRKKVLGENHPDYVQSLNNLAALYVSMGDYAKALPLYEQAREITKKVRGENHPHYATSLNILALLYQSMGEYAKALPLFEQAREITKKVRGEKHPDYVQSLNNLAGLYKEMGEYAKALPLYEQAREITKKVRGEKHPDYAQSLNNLAGLYEAMGEYAKALPLYEQARDLCKKVLGENHPDYAQSLNTLAVLYVSMGDYAKALPLYEQARDLRKKVLGENHPDYAGSLNNLAALYVSMGDYPKALSLFEQARDLRKKVLGENHPLYATSLNNLAGLYKEMGDYAKALPLFEQARDLRKKVLGENHPDYAASLNNLAVLYEAMGDYAKALPLYEQARDLRKKVLGENHPDYAASLNNLATLYQSMGNYAKALPLFEQARDLHKKVLGENHPLYATSLNNLAALSKEMGDYAKALPLFEQARDLRKKVLGENHPDYAASLYNLAGLYKDMGDYPKALPLSQQALNLHKKVLGENHPLYAASLDNLAGLCGCMGDHPKALLLFEQARELRKKVLGENHPLYASSLSNLALLYKDMGDYAKALPLFEQARDLRKKVLGENHPDYAQSLNNLALLYQDVEDYAKALPLFEQARDLRKKALGENHPDYAAILNNLAVLYRLMGDHATAERLFGQALDLSLQLLQDSFDVVGERQRLERVNSLRHVINNFILGARETRLPPAEVYAAILKWKGSVAFRQSAELLLRDQPALKPILQKLHSVRAQLAKSAFETPAPAQRNAWLRRLEQLRDDKEKLEQELAQASQTFRNHRRPPPPLDQLRQALPKGTVLIDLLVYHSGAPPEKRKVGKNEWTPHLAAFVVRADQDVQLVFVEDLKRIETLIEAWRQAVLDDNATAQASAAEMLQQELWQPLQKHLGSADTVLISPDGPLLRFPFAALPGKRPGTFLIEDIAIGYVTSGRQIVDLLQPADKGLAAPAGFLGLGGINYGSSPGNKQAFLPLPGTDLEVGRAADHFRRRFPEERSTLLLAGQPTRPRIMEEINRRYRYLHLATHGFFESPARIAALRASLRASEAALSLEQRSQRDDLLAFLPLLKCGLVLAGANQSEGDEALLTAEDLNSLDLRGTDLVVLSACETSLGNLTEGDGVLGLQRGFHAGGARTLVTSLWSVNDAATSVLMEEFYKNLWNKDKPLGKLEALRQAQLYVLKNPERVIERTKELRAELARRGWSEDELRGPKGKKPVELPDGGAIKPGQSRRSPPAWWAAFVLSGDIEAAKR